MKLVHWPLMSGLLHLVQRGGDLGGAAARPGLLLAVSNVTAHSSTASVLCTVPVTVLLYNGPLLCGFNVLIKELSDMWAYCSAVTAGHSCFARFVAM